VPLSSAQLASLSTQLAELATQVTATADELVAARRNDLGMELYGVERALLNAARKVDRVIKSIDS
jgi:hypothetical protein